MSGEPPSGDPAIRLFEAACDLPPAERAGFLAEACRGDRTLLDRVRRLLGADAGGGPLDRPIGPAALLLLEDQAAPAVPPEDVVGRIVGSYRIVDVLGRGGMGTVYLAERADGSFEARVALKFVRSGHRGTELEAHFRRERRILARLEHPGIARLFDAGLTAEGTPYFVMERVDGLPITEHALRAGLGVDARLRLFLEVADAVRHAHRNLVVHRDIKPANVLVTADSRVKLLDFGIARLLEERPGDGESPSRATGLLLTPEYAAPEQLAGGPAATSEDVFGLGCLLFELLAGTRPRRLEGLGWAGIVAALEKDVDVPPSRHLPAGPARRRVRGELDAIVLHALRSDPGTRYPSVNTLAEDVRRFLAGLPVTARPSTAPYRARKFVGRHRPGVAAGALLILVFAAGLASTLWQARTASAEADRADAVAGFLFDLFEAADPERNRGAIPDARQLLDLGVGKVDSVGAAAGPEVRADLFAVLGSLYGKLGAYEAQADLYERAAALCRDAFGPGDRRTTAALHGLGVALTELGRLDAADSVLSESLRLRRLAGAPDTALAGSLGGLAAVASRHGDFAAAVPLYRRALALDTRAEGRDGLRVAADLNDIGAILTELEEFAEARSALERSLDIRLRRLGGDHPDIAITVGLLGRLESALGDRVAAERRHREALAMQRRLYPDGHPDIARSLDQLAIQLDHEGRRAEADSVYAEALRLRTDWLGPAHPDVASTLNNIATLRYAMGRYAEAATAMEQALALWRTALGERHVNVATGYNNLGAMRREMGDLSGAEQVLRQALSLRRDLRGRRHTDVGATLANLAGVHRLQGRTAEAELEYREAMSIFSEHLPPGHSRLADAAAGLGATLLDEGRPAEALALLEPALAARRTSLREDDPRLAETRLWWAVALSRSGRRTEARIALEEVRPTLAAALGDGARLTRRAEQELARLGP